MSIAPLRAAQEAIEAFPCFGGRCMVIVQGPGPGGTASEAAVRARDRMLEWHQQFTRFDPHSELSQLNDDRRETVPVSAMMARFVEQALAAASATNGLVDSTLVSDLERAGYRAHLESPGIPLPEALALAPSRAPARAHHAAAWHHVSVDRRACTVTRPPGIRVDSGGIAKGLFGDVLASVLGAHASFVVAAAGDLRFGGAGGVRHKVQVASPFDDSILHVFELVSGAAATSGIGRRSWIGGDGHPAHHLLNPATGRPAFTGVVQATALAPTATEGEALSKAALLSGPGLAVRWLRHGGLVVYDDGGIEVAPPPACGHVSPPLSGSAIRYEA
jgi:thiamine biosynthesis lipoprotein